MIMLNKKNYNKYGEYVGNTVITRAQIGERVKKLGYRQIFLIFLLTLGVSVIFLPLLPFAIGSVGGTLANAGELAKFQLVGRWIFHIISIAFTAGLPAYFIYVTVTTFIVSVKLIRGEFDVDVDEVDYLDVVVRRSRRHTKEMLVIHFYKYGRIETGYRFDSGFAEHNEKFYVVVTRGKKPVIVDFLRCSKFEYQE